MKGTKVQTLNASAVAGAWRFDWAIIIVAVQLLIHIRTAN